MATRNESETRSRTMSREHDEDPAPRKRGKRGHGTIEKRGQWFVHVQWKTDRETGKRKRMPSERRHRTRKEAEAYLANYAKRAEQLRGSAGATSQWLHTHWLPLRNKHASAADRRWIDARVRLMELAPWFDTLPVDEVEADDIYDWLDVVAQTPKRRGGSYARGTVQSALGQLRMFFAWMGTKSARKLGSPCTRANPCAGISVAKAFADDPMNAPPHAPKDRHTLIDPAVIRRIIDGVEGMPLDARAFFLAVAFSGVRPGHLLRVRWADVDLDTGRMMIRNNRKAGAKAGGEYMTALLSYGLDAVRELRASLDRDRTLVFARPDSGQWSQAFRFGWTGQHGRDGWRDRLGVPGVTCYSLKHTCATMLVAGDPLWVGEGGKGWNRDELQRQLGHQDAGSVEHYMRLGNEVGFAAAARVQAKHAERRARLRLVQ